MKLERIENGLQATVPCKVNLFLEVLDKRPDGYHELDTVMLGVSLCDRLSLYPQESEQWELSVSFAPELLGANLTQTGIACSVPADSSNLVIRAVHLYASKLGLHQVGGRMQLHKSIPSMAGLGGGSADAAAALVLAHAVWGTEGDWQAVLESASELGSDINFFLEGRNQESGWLAHCRGRGEVVVPLPGKLQALALLIVHPPASCSTADVFARFRARQSHKRSSAELIRELQTGEGVGIGKELYNVLEAPACQVTDWISRAGRWIDRYDHFGQTLSGTGSARFCLCASWEQAENIARELQSQDGLRAYAVRPWYQPSLDDQLKAIKGMSPMTFRDGRSWSAGSNGNHRSTNQIDGGV